MLKTINSDGSLKISLIGSAVPAGAIYNGGLAYAPDGSLYVKLTQGALSGQTYNGGLACTPDGALYVANSTPAASATFRRGLLCRADGAVHVSDATVATVRHDGGVPKDNAGRLFVGIPLSGLAASFDANTGITSSGGFASAWADQSGNGRNLLQATGANQPIHLPFAGAKYGYLSGDAGNYFSTPSSTATQIGGSKTILLNGIKLADIAPVTYKSIVSTFDATAALGYSLFQDQGAPGCLVYFHRIGGLTYSVVSTATLAAVGVAANTEFDLAVTHDIAGTVKFWYDTGAGWAQLGASVATAAGATTGLTSPLTIMGVADIPASYNNAGSVARMRLYSGVVTDLDAGTGGPLAVDFDPSRWTSGTTFTASTGETWTINSTGSKPAQIVDRPSLLFDGAANYMKCSAFTLNQPETIYLVARQISWTLNDYLCDGNSGSSMVIYQDTTTPRVMIYAGTFTGLTESGMTVGADKVVCGVFNGASSSIQVNAGASQTGNAGVSNAGGFTLAANASGASAFANIQVYEALIYNVAHDAATRANIIRALMSKHGVA